MLRAFDNALRNVQNKFKTINFFIIYETDVVFKEQKSVKLES